MKKVSLVIFIFTILFIIGCQSNQSKQIDSKSEINLDKLIQYKNSYVGDNSAVGNILYNLPG